MDVALMAQFGIMAALMVMIPGADWAYAISAGLHARRVLPSIGGMLAGYVLLVGAIAVGLGALVATRPQALVLITLVGAAYLVWLGLSTLLRTFRTAPVLSGADGEPVLMDDPRAQFLKGAGISGTNPKALLLLLALLPQFLCHGGWAVPVQLMVLGSIFILCCGIIYSGVAHLARRLLRSRPAAGVLITRASGVMMTAIGASLAAEKVVQVLG